MLLDLSHIVQYRRMFDRLLDSTCRLRRNRDFSRRRGGRSRGNGGRRLLLTLGCSCCRGKDVPRFRRHGSFRFSAHRRRLRSDLGHNRSGRSRFFCRGFGNCGRRSDFWRFRRSSNCCCRKVNGRSSHNFRHGLLATPANDATTESLFINLLVYLSGSLKLLEIALFKDTLVTLCVDSGLMQTLNHLFVFKSEFLGQFENFSLSHQYSPAIRW
jgi:hypothetical protein